MTAPSSSERANYLRRVVIPALRDQLRLAEAEERYLRLLNGTTVPSEQEEEES